MGVSEALVQVFYRVFLGVLSCGRFSPRGLPFMAFVPGGEYPGVCPGFVQAVYHGGHIIAVVF